MHCKATDKDDPTVDPRLGKVGKQTIEDTGPLTKKRMETIDDETTAAAVDYMERQAKTRKPFFVWMNTTRMHLRTHVRARCAGQAGMPDNEYADGMIEHDGHVGKLLKALDDLEHRRRHHRPLHDRQRPAHELLAGRRDDSVPQREEYELGRGVPRVRVHDPLAGEDQARQRVERDRQRPRLVADIARRGRRPRRQGEASERPRGGRQDVQGPPRRLQSDYPT